MSEIQSQNGARVLTQIVALSRYCCCLNLGYLLHSLPGIAPGGKLFIDDFLIFGKNKEEQDKSNPEKACKFQQSRINQTLGRTKDGPTLFLTDLKMFMGMINQVLTKDS